MVERRDAEGFVLVGGRSSRMGADKATLPLAGKPLAAWIADRMAPAVDYVSLVGHPQTHGSMGLPVIPDLYPGLGPVGAIITALRSSTSTWNIVVACDLPAVTSDIFEALLLRIRTTGAQCVIPITPDGRRQVLCAVYRRDAAEQLSKALENGELRLRSAIDTLKTEFWHAESSDWAINLNTPEEWAAFAPAEIA